MALTVEDGTGLVDADSFVTLEEADAYHTAAGSTNWTGTDESKEQALRRASRFLSDSFKYKGYPVKGRDQNLAWPRYYVEDYEGYSIDSDEIPIEVRRATFIVAAIEVTSPGSMNPSVALSSRVTREKVGPLEVEYKATQTDAWADRPVVTQMIDILGPLLKSGSRSKLAGVKTRI